MGFGAPPIGEGHLAMPTVFVSADDCAQTGFCLEGMGSYGKPVRPKFSSVFLRRFPLGELSECLLRPKLSPPKLSGVRVRPKLSGENFPGGGEVDRLGHAGMCPQGWNGA